MTVTVHVTYRGDAATRFDRDYYVAEHLPLVMRAWGPYGLLSCTALFPAAAEAGTLCIAECRFRDEAAPKFALAAPETAGVMADVDQFTDAKPEQTRSVPV